MQLPRSCAMLLIQDDTGTAGSTASGASSTATGSADTVAQTATQAQQPVPVVQDIPYALWFEIFFCAALVFITILLWLRSRTILMAITASNKALQESFHNEISRLTSKTAHEVKDKSGKPDQAIAKQVETLLQDGFNKLYKELGEDHNEVIAAIQKLSLQKTASSLSKTAAAGTNSPSASSSKTSAQTRLSPEELFVSDLVEDYNSIPDAEFETKYGTKPAQLQEKGTTRLGPHAAGSFSVVESGGRWYGLPRRRVITPTGHENAGFQLLFRYNGYDSKKPETAFYLEMPATLMPDGNSGWSLREPGQLRLKTEEN